MDNAEIRETAPKRVPLSNSQSDGHVEDTSGLVLGVHTLHVGNDTRQRHKSSDAEGYLQPHVGVGVSAHASGQLEESQEANNFVWL